MGLKNEKGNYLKVAVLESINVIHGKAYIRIYQYDDEEQRQKDLYKPEKNFCVQEVDITSEQINLFQKAAYEMLKNHKVKTGEDEEDDDIFDYPYSDMIDC